MLWLVGMPGAGKTTVALHLGMRRNIVINDTDSYISLSVGDSVDRIVKTFGMDAFRRMELMAVKDILEPPPPGIVVLGGGALAVSEIAKIVRYTGKCVYLRASPELLADRTWDNSRPMLKGLGWNERLRKLTELLEERRDLYESAADFIIDVDRGASPRDIALDIIARTGML